MFADGQVDRSPTGSGVSTRLALMHRRGQVGAGETRRFRSITGEVFEGRVTAPTRAGPHAAVVTEVAGRAYHTGEARFTVEAGRSAGLGLPARPLSGRVGCSLRTGR